MKFINLNKTMKVAAISSVFLASFATQAALSEGVTVEEDLVFTSPLAISHTLVAKSGLTSGAQTGSPYIEIAKGTLATLAGTIDKYLVGFGVPGSLETSSSATGAYSTELQGKNNPSNTLTVRLANSSNGASIGTLCSTVGANICKSDGYIYQVNASSGSYIVAVANGTKVQPDTYTVQVTAYGYAS